MSCSFTLEHYCEIIEIAKKSGYLFRGFHDTASGSDGLSIYLRHDIDVCLEEATEIARVEAEARIGGWIGKDYNRLYVHSALGYLSPEEFAQQWVQSQEATSEKAQV